MITVSHTHEAGTLVEGTARGDGSADVLKTHGLRWSRTLGQWYVPRSRDTDATPPALDTLADALRAAGHQVDVQIDDTARAIGDVEADRAERSDARTDRLTDKAARLAQVSATHDSAYRQIADLIPFGQPVLVDHHSAPRHRRDLDRMHRHAEAGYVADLQAAEAEKAARASAAHIGARYAPHTVANRIDRLQAEQRQLARLLADTATPHPSTAARAVKITEEVAYWHAVRAEQISTGAATAYSAATVHVGDTVRIRGHWRKVARANAKTVSVETRLQLDPQNPVARRRRRPPQPNMHELTASLQCW